MQKILPGQNKRLHQLLTTTGLTEQKEDLVRAYSSIASPSSKDLLINEAKALILHLESMAPEPPPNAARIAGDRMRKKMIALAYKMHWTDRAGKIDLQRLNIWCLSYGLYKKRLNAHTNQELTKLLSQFEKVYQSFLEGINKH